MLSCPLKLRLFKQENGQVSDKLNVRCLNNRKKVFSEGYWRSPVILTDTANKTAYLTKKLETESSKNCADSHYLGGDPSAGSPTDTLLRLNPPH